MGDPRKGIRIQSEKQAHNSSWEESSVVWIIFFSSLVNSNCPKKLPPFPLWRLRMLGYRRLHCLLYVEISSSVNLMESRARLSRKYMVQKKIMDFNSGAKFHGNFLISAFLEASLRYEASSHLTCSSNAKVCHAHVPSNMDSSETSWVMWGMPITGATCPSKRTTHFRDQPLDSWVSMEPCGSGSSRG